MILSILFLITSLPPIPGGAGTFDIKPAKAAAAALAGSPKDLSNAFLSLPLTSKSSSIALEVVFAKVSSNPVSSNDLYEVPGISGAWNCSCVIPAGAGIRGFTPTTPPFLNLSAG